MMIMTTKKVNVDRRQINGRMENNAASRNSSASYIRLKLHNNRKLNYSLMMCNVDVTHMQAHRPISIIIDDYSNEFIISMRTAVTTTIREKKRHAINFFSGSVSQREDVSMHFIY